MSSLLLAAPAFADSIYSSFGVGYTYGIGGFYTAFDFGGATGVIDVDVASKFNTGASAYSFDSARLGAFQTPGASGSAFTLWLMSDNGGNPGSIIETIAYTGAAGGFGSNLLVAASGASVLAANTAYWIGIGSTWPDAINWQLNNIGAVASGSMAFAQMGGAWLFQDVPLALEVNGTLVQVPVPEPGSLALVALAIAALGAIRRKPVKLQQDAV